MARKRATGNSPRERRGPSERTTRRASAPSPLGSIRELAREAYREAIIAAAEAVFARRGFTGTKMTDIAREAGTAIGTLYNYFDSKESICLSMMEARAGELFSRLDEAIAGERTPIAKIAAFIRAGWAHVDESATLFSALAEANLSGRHQGSAMCEHGEAIQTEIRRILVGLVAAAQDAGELRDDLPPEEMAEFLTGAMHRFVHHWRRKHPDHSLSARAPLILDLFFNGAKPS